MRWKRLDAGFPAGHHRRAGGHAAGAAAGGDRLPAAAHLRPQRLADGGRLAGHHLRHAGGATL